MTPQEQISALLHTAEDSLNEAERIAFDNNLPFEFKPTNAPQASYDGLADKWYLFDIEDWCAHQDIWLSSSAYC